jgi:hypothetical protein
MMKNKKVLPYLLLIVIVIAVLLLKNCGKQKSSNNPPTTETKKQRGLNRNPAAINYSKHAKCRMACRHIDEQEVKDILQKGNINYKKSELNGEDCKKKYALEGLTKDNQRVRIIFAPCQDELTVVTCIDLNTDWECVCNGE